MNIVLIGAGGTGMSGVAGILHDLGFSNLVCIDGFQSQLTDKLKEKGIKVIIGHGKYKVDLNDIVIYSEAVHDCVEIQEAKKLFKEKGKIFRSRNYFQFLGEISKYFQTVGISGTNGKSSTTSMAIYTTNKLNSKFGLGILGALVPQFKNNSYLINNKIKSDLKNIFDYIIIGKKLNYDNIKKYIFIVEACEYKRHFLNLDLDYSIITNIELDHTDYYKNLKDYQNAFSQLIQKTKHKVLVLENRYEKISKITKEKDKIVKIKKSKFGFKYILGDHNQQNGSLVRAIIKNIDKKIAIKKITDTIINFKGLRRRLEFLGTNQNGAKIYSDYGHMASSIQVGYETLKAKFKKEKVTVIFQPHQINRIETGRNDFIKVFKNYDQVFIYDIYAARESLDTFKKFKIKSIQDLGENFAKVCGGKYISDFKEIKKTIQSGQKNEIIVIYSAGDIDYQIRQNIKLKI
ncbi:hypothetical protein K9M48_02875 [Candidatus Gracilibacteria bacterium]|nr:hypothetical protein [Candidatus Gracilibacteria bacterium]